ncbi:MAG: hypothetical protein WBE68_27000 [Candidatus Nitrosopolaris sp.]
MIINVRGGSELLNEKEGSAYDLVSVILFVILGLVPTLFLSTVYGTEQ